MDSRAVNTPLAEQRVQYQVSVAEGAQTLMNVSAAQLWESIADTLAEAAYCPQVFVPDASAPDAVEFAVRAAAMELSVVLGMSQNQVRTLAHHATVLQARAPRSWGQFRAGLVSVANARVLAELAAEVPAELWTAFDAAMFPLLGRVSARFRTAARTAVERLQPETMSARHERAARGRAVWVEDHADGMSTLSICAPTIDVHRAWARIDATARHLAAHPGTGTATPTDDLRGPRTLDQLRADTATDLIAGTLGTPGSVGVTVAVTVPVMTLAGQHLPATLNGLIPIDPNTARRLTAHAPHLTRLLTDPINGTLLEVDTRTHHHRHPGAALDRAVTARDRICVAPGCADPPPAATSTTSTPTPTADPPPPPTSPPSAETTTAPKPEPSGPTPTPHPTPAFDPRGRSPGPPPSAARSPPNPHPSSAPVEAHAPDLRLFVNGGAQHRAHWHT